MVERQRGLFLPTQDYCSFSIFSSFGRKVSLIVNSLPIVNSLAGTRKLCRKNILPWRQRENLGLHNNIRHG